MLFNIQVLRGIAAALVVWVHAQEIIPGTNIPHAVRHIGFAGVDLFFVISGFIMVHSTIGKSITPQSFFYRRVKRIAPLYYTFTLLVCAICLFFPMLFKSSTVDFISFYKSVLFIPFEKSADRIYPIYFLGWTLNYEMFFYALFSIALLVRPEVRTPSICVVLAILAGVGLFISTPEQFGVVPYFYTRPIILDFAMGMIIAEHDYRRPMRGAISARVFLFALFAGCLALIIGEAFFSQPTSNVAPQTNTFLSFGFPVALIVWGAAGLDKAGLKIGTGWMGKLGDASYSVYLSHYLTVGTISALLSHTPFVSEFARIAATPLTMAAAIGMGMLVYMFVERPLSGDFRHMPPLFRRSPSRMTN